MKLIKVIFCRGGVTPEVLFMMNTELKLAILADNQTALIQAVNGLTGVVQQMATPAGVVGGEVKCGGRIITPGPGGFTHDPGRGRGGR